MIAQSYDWIWFLVGALLILPFARRLFRMGSRAGDKLTKGIDARHRCPYCRKLVSISASVCPYCRNAIQPKAPAR